MARTRKKQGEPTIVKKYANRRLYDTGRSSYVTLEDLCEMVKEGHDFVVVDAKTGDDLTRQVLTQIIIEQEAKGENLLPVTFLRELIGMYGENFQSLVPTYLEQTIETFKQNQKNFQEQINRSFEGVINPVSAMEDINRKNMEMFQTALRAWNPFTSTGSKPSATETAPAEEINRLKKNIAEMEAEIARLKKQTG